MIASRISRRTCAVVTLLALSVCAVKVLAESFTWTGDAQDNKWREECNWIKPNCSPCYGCGYPNDAGDDAIITTPYDISLVGAAATVNSLTIHNSDVRFYGGIGGGGICETGAGMSADVIVISAANGQSAQLRGSNCTTVSTYDD